MKTTFPKIRPASFSTILCQTVAGTLLLLLGACGGSSLQIAEGGIGGTGITMGRISGFGSIIVNDIKFNISGASLYRDSVLVNDQSEYSIGEIVTIVGDIAADGVSGTANSVTFKNNVEGPLTRIISAQQIEVLGQVILLDAATQLLGFTRITDLQAGTILEISGYLDAASQIRASSIKRKDDEEGELEIRGIISNLDIRNQRFTINNLWVDYRDAEFKAFSEDQLRNGLTVEAEGEHFENGILTAKELELETSEEFDSGTELEIQGLVTRFVSSQDFDVNGRRVVISASTVFEHGSSADLALNIEIEVKGELDASSQLVAEKIEFKD